MRLATSLPLLLLPPLMAQQTFRELQRSQIPALPWYASKIAAIDYDGDGDRDLVCMPPGGYPLVWLNVGHGRFGFFGAFLSPGATNRDLAIGDLDGDGTEDLVWATANNGLLVRSGSNFLDPFPQGLQPPTSPSIRAVALLDVDGDGDLDIVLDDYNPVGSEQRLWLNGGAGQFVDGTSAWFGGGLQLPQGTSFFLPFDCDGDGDSDLLLLAAHGSQLLINQGGTFVAAPPLPLPPSATFATCAAAGDVDGDGDLDLVIGTGYHTTPQQDRLLLNQGSGGFVDATATSLPSLANVTASVHFIDLDNDGDLDLLVTHEEPMATGNRLGHSLLRNDGTGHFSDASAELPDNDLAGAAAAVFDVDGDGDDDYVFASQLGVRLYWNDHGHLFDTAGAALPPRPSLATVSAAGDLDGDGAIDLVGGGQHPYATDYRAVLQWNDGTGHYDESMLIPSSPLAFSAAALGDLDGDGDLDLVLGVDQGGQNQIYRNDGNRVFTNITAAALPPQLGDTKAVQVFDADGDGDLDILFGNSGTCRQLANTGIGVFTDVTTTSLPPNSGTNDLAVGDVDGDGDLDVVRAVGGGANELWRNTGGVFQIAVGALPNMVQSNSAIALADLDGDQDLDLIVANHASGVLDDRSWILRNTGNGIFTNPISLGHLGVSTVAAGDLEGDGDVDFVLGWTNLGPLVFENLGGGFFLNHTDELWPVYPFGTRLMVVDVDGDGDLDLFEGARVAVNMHHQLYSDALFLPGSTPHLHGSVAATGQPGSLAAAAVFLGLPGTPTATPFGVARLDLTTLVPLGFHVLSASLPDVDEPVTVPASPSLLGLMVGAQMLALHDSGSWALSNLVVETVRQ